MLQQILYLFVLKSDGTVPLSPKSGGTPVNYAYYHIFLILSLPPQVTFAPPPCGSSLATGVLVKCIAAYTDLSSTVYEL